MVVDSISFASQEVVQFCYQHDFRSGSGVYRIGSGVYRICNGVCCTGSDVYSTGSGVYVPTNLPIWPICKLAGQSANLRLTI